MVFFFLFLHCSFFLLLHSRKRSDSEDEEFAYKQSYAIVANQPRPSFDWNSSCRRDQNYKPTAEYVGSSLSQIAEGKILESSDQPRLILLHELFSWRIKERWLHMQQLNEIKLCPVMPCFFGYYYFAGLLGLGFFFSFNVAISCWTSETCKCESVTCCIGLLAL